MVGTPRINYMPYPFEIVQTPNQITILYEYVHTSRHLRLNSNHPEGAIQWIMGDSRARWDGEALVVDVVHFSDQNWLDRSGNYHSADMHMVERWTRTGPDHLSYDATIEDPRVFSRPWTIRMPLYRRVPGVSGSREGSRQVDQKNRIRRNAAERRSCRPGAASHRA
jgi:hypothetical protein